MNVWTNNAAWYWDRPLIIPSHILVVLSSNYCTSCDVGYKGILEIKGGCDLNQIALKYDLKFKECYD